VSTEPIVRDEHVQRAVWFAGALAHLRAGAAETGGRWAMVDQVAERGYSVPLHIHNREAETLLVIDGTCAGCLRRRGVPVVGRWSDHSSDGSVPCIRGDLADGPNPRPY
jgi:hypothetical protein